MIHDFTSGNLSPVPQFRGDFPIFCRELTQWLSTVSLSHKTDLENLFIVTILAKIAGNPPKPLVNKGIIWTTDGTGSVATALSAAAGDVLIANNDGIRTVPDPDGLTQCGILFDHSAGTVWP